MLSWFKRKPVRPTYFEQTLNISYADVGAAKQWWADVFGCEQTAMPDWDDVQPEDVAMKFAGAEEPTICLTQASADARPENERQLVWTASLKAALEDLREHGAKPGPIQEGRVRSFEIHDPEGNLIEICEE